MTRTRRNSVPFMEFRSLDGALRRKENWRLHGNDTVARKYLPRRVNGATADFEDARSILADGFYCRP